LEYIKYIPAETVSVELRDNHTDLILKNKFHTEVTNLDHE